MKAWCNNTETGAQNAIHCRGMLWRCRIHFWMDKWRFGRLRSNCIVKVGSLIQSQQ